MPASRKITRKEIVDGAFAVLREGGFSAVNARSVAQKLGCSTQPIYLSFQNMEALKVELTARAIQEHTERVTAAICGNHGSHSHYSDYGIGFVRFAEQEKQLFRWLYLGEGQNEIHDEDVLLPEILRTISQEYGYEEAVARQIHRDMTFYSYGLAILANIGRLHVTDEELIRAFKREFLALTSIYGPPPKQQDSLKSCSVSSGPTERNDLKK